MTEPTDAELGKLAEECGIGWAAGLGGMSDFLSAFARAVLAKWGTPAGAGEAAEHYRNAIASACEGWTMPDGLRKHLETALWSPPTPQPTKPQAGAVPLTDEQIRALMQAHRTAMLMTCKARAPECGEFAAIAQDLDWLCESFGIKGCQYGTE